MPILHHSTHIQVLDGDIFWLGFHQHTHPMVDVKLSGIRQTARTSRKNEKNLDTWSFHRLANFIEYKAILAGLTVEFVDPS
jgi:transposase